MEYLNVKYIKHSALKSETENTGGGCLVDFLVHRDCMISTNDECLVVQQSKDEFYLCESKVVPFYHNMDDGDFDTTVYGLNITRKHNTLVIYDDNKDLIFAGDLII